MIQRFVPPLVLLASFALLACGGKGSATDAGDAEPADVRSDAGDVASDSTSEADTAQEDATGDGASDGGETTDAGADPVDDVTPDPDVAADAGPADAAARDADAAGPDAPDSDAPDSDAPDADAADADATDADAADADATDTDAGDLDPPPPAWLKLVNPLAAQEEWFTEASFGRSAAIDGDVYVVGADEDNQRGTRAGAILIGSRVDGRWISERFAPVDLGEVNRFGASVDVSDGVIAVGARNDSRSEDRAGSVWIIERVGGAWVVSDVIESPAPEALARFGATVALDGDTLAVGSSSDDVANGRVDVFRRGESARFEHLIELRAPGASDVRRFGNTLALGEDTLVVGDAESSTVYVYAAPYRAAPRALPLGRDVRFGAALAIDDGWLLVGAPDDVAGEVAGVGRVYVYAVTGPGDVTLRGDLSLSALSEGDRFGEAVAIDGESVLVGAFRVSGLAERSGAAFRYVFEDGAFRLVDTLEPPTLGVGHRFGIVVAADGGTAIVTAIGDNTLAESSGASYRYSFDADLPAEPVREFVGTLATDDRFGASVATSGDEILVGVPGDDTLAEDAGAVLVFRAEGGRYRLVQRLARPEAPAGQELGISMDADGDWLAVGAPGDPRDGVDGGAVLVWQRVDGAWTYRNTIRPFGGMPDGRYGTAVDLDADRLLVGAEFREDEFGFGGAFLHRRVDAIWAFVSRIDAVDGALRPDADAQVGYGRAVAIDGTQIFVAYPGDYDGRGGNVAPLIYDGGPLSALLPFGLELSGARFGSAIAAAEGEVLVGAPGIDNVYVLLPGAATYFPTLAAEGAEGSEFGAAIALGIGRAAVGAPKGNERAGEAVLVERGDTGWAIATTYRADDASFGQELGASVALADDAPRTALVAGAPGDDERGGNAGAVYVFFD